MTKYTTTSLIEELKKFPEDTPIKTDLAFIFNYNDMWDFFKDEMSDDEFLDFSKAKATDVAIFEGSWEEDNISDINNIMSNYVDGWYKTKITIDKDEYEKLKSERIKINTLTINTAHDPIHIHDTLIHAIEEIMNYDKL